MHRRSNETAWSKYFSTRKHGSLWHHPRSFLSSGSRAPTRGLLAPPHDPSKKCGESLSTETTQAPAKSWSTSDTAESILHRQSPP